VTINKPFGYRFNANLRAEAPNRLGEARLAVQHKLLATKTTEQRKQATATANGDRDARNKKIIWLALI